MLIFLPQWCLSRCLLFSTNELKRIILLELIRSKYTSKYENWCTQLVASWLRSLRFLTTCWWWWPWNVARCKWPGWLRRHHLPERLVVQHSAPLFCTYFSLTLFSSFPNTNVTMWRHAAFSSASCCLTNSLLSRRPLSRCLQLHASVNI